MSGNAHQNSKPHEHRQQGGSTVTDERQWHADHGKDAAYHAHIDKRVSEKSQSYGGGQQTRENCRGIHGDHHATPDDDDVERDEQHNPRLSRTPRPTPPG